MAHREKPTLSYCVNNLQRKPAHICQVLCKLQLTAVHHVVRHISPTSALSMCVSVAGVPSKSNGGALEGIKEEGVRMRQQRAGAMMGTRTRTHAMMGQGRRTRTWSEKKKVGERSLLEDCGRCGVTPPCELNMQLSRYWRSQPYHLRYGHPESAIDFSLIGGEVRGKQKGVRHLFDCCEWKRQRAWE